MLENVKFKLLSFQNAEQARIAVKDLQGLVNHPGWKFLIERVIDLNIRMLRKDLETKEGMSTEQNDILKRDLRFLRNLKNLPQFQIDTLMGRTPELETYDPYFQDIESLETQTGVTVVDVQAPKEPPRVEKPKAI